MKIEKLQGTIISFESKSFIVHLFDTIKSPIPKKVLYTDHFASSIGNAIVGNKVSLIHVEVDFEAEILRPQLIIIEPDYLVDVSAVSECMREYGSHPFYFLMNRCLEKVNTAPLLLGNAANFFLDELIYADDPKGVDAIATIKKYFQLYPLELALCQDLKDADKEKSFFHDLVLHFENLRSVIVKVFADKGIERHAAALEPSFICPQLGLQGRLDFFEKKEKAINTVIELKSGKTPFFDYEKTAIGLNHQTQASLYQIIIQQVLGIPFASLQTYICYSRCKENDNPLRLAYPSIEIIAEALNIRNHIALNDYKIAHDAMSSAQLFAQIMPERMIKSDDLDSKLVSQYIKPQIEKFSNCIDKNEVLEKEYFFAYYKFLVKEQWLSKCGQAANAERSFASLWLLDKAQKKQNGTLMDGLYILDKEWGKDYTLVTFSSSPNPDSVSDFRSGDIIVLYPNRNEEDDATKHQVYKGNIYSINAQQIVLRLRNHQFENSLSQSFSYSIEHDVLDSNYTQQFKGLYSFLSCKEDRKSLVLATRAPHVTIRPLPAPVHTFSSTVQRLLKKVVCSDELFLIVGPPGTGKTSIALKSIVSYLYSQTDECLLISAYTNRAVDEICLALDSIEFDVSYVRLGSHVNCAKSFQNRLLNEQIKAYTKRTEVVQFIKNKRIFVGTVAAWTLNTELLSNKKFDRAIIDEASQILDPQILSLLCQKTKEGDFSIDKFILIGDSKQLPAVSMQTDSQFSSETLQKNGILNGKTSFFERMFQLYAKDENIVMELLQQGRMHPSISQFPNNKFYSGQLQPIPMAHQEAPLIWRFQDYNGDKLILAKSRQHYFPIEETAMAASIEAQKIASLVQDIWHLYEDHNLSFNAETSLGIITPFRSQVVLIQKHIQNLNILQLNDIVVDTVERYQGSQRDIIIFSFGVFSKNQLNQVTESVTQIGDTLVDRKMNVALTRARKQFFFVGSSYWTKQNPLYHELVNHLLMNSL